MKLPRITLSPAVRKLFASAALVTGVVLAGRELRGSAPRDIEVSVSLRAFDDASLAVRSVDVTFLRDDAPLRALRCNFSGRAPREVRETVALPEGPLRARVSVTLDAIVVERESYVTVVAGETIALPAPGPP